MATDDTIAILRRAPVVGAFEENALRVIANVGDARRLRPGEILFRQGERSDGGYVVLSGAILVDRDGDDDAVTLGPGSVVGQLALFNRMQRPGTAVARDMSVVLRISPTLMKRVLQEYPSAAAGMVAALTAGLEETRADLDRMERLFAPEPAPAA